MAWWEAIAGIGNVAAGLTQGILNPIMQHVTNKENIAFQQQENEITRQREDTAHQREVADLEKAGLSPLANTGGAQTQQMTAPSVEAPQMDAGALQDSIAVLLDQERRKEELEESKRQHDETLTHEKEVLAETKRQFDENQELTKNIQNAQIKNDIEKFLIQEERLNNAIEWENEDKSKKSKIEMSTQSEITYRNLCETWQYNFKRETYTDYVQYLHAKKQMDSQLNNFIKWFSDPDVIKKGEPNNSAGGSGSIGGNGHAGPIGGGGNIGASGNYSKDTTWQRQGQMEKWIKQYCEANKISRNEFMVVPIYAPRDVESARKNSKSGGNWTYLD